MCEIFTIIGGTILGAVGAAGASAGVATAVGVGASAALGAGIGAGAAAIKGGSIWKGALFGAAGGVMGAGALGGAALAGAGAAGIASGSTASVIAAGAGASVGGVTGGAGGGLMSSKMDNAKMKANASLQAQKAAIEKIQKTSQTGVQTIQRTATALKDKNLTNRTLSSLRIGLNTADTNTGLNIPT